MAKSKVQNPLGIDRRLGASRSCSTIIRRKGRSCPASGHRKRLVLCGDQPHHGTSASPRHAAPTQTRHDTRPVMRLPWSSLVLLLSTRFRPSAHRLLLRHWLLAGRAVGRLPLPRVMCSANTSSSVASQAEDKLAMSMGHARCTSE